MEHKIIAAAAGMSAVTNGYDGDDEECGGRILNDSEYAEMLKKRGDIFLVAKESRQRNVQLAAIILAVGFITFMSTRTVANIVATDFLEPNKLVREATLVNREQVAAMLEEKKKQEKEKQEKEEVKSDRKTLKPTNSRGTSQNVGGGDPRARIASQGVLGILSDQIKGKSVASADIFGKGGFATDIDAIIVGVQGLKEGGSGGVGRKGMAGIGQGFGPGSGFGGPGMGGGIDDLMKGLTQGGVDLAPRQRGELKIASPDFVTGGQLTGGRSRASIQRVVLQNMAALRHAYNRRLRETPGLAGKITVKFAIDEFGGVIFAQVVETTVNDPELEKIVVARVRSWAFEKIDKPGDITEIVYPFVFSQ